MSSTIEHKILDNSRPNNAVLAAHEAWLSKRPSADVFRIATGRKNGLLYHPTHSESVIYSDLNFGGALVDKGMPDGRVGLTPDRETAIRVARKRALYGTLPTIVVFKVQARGHEIIEVGDAFIYVNALHAPHFIPVAFEGRCAPYQDPSEGERSAWHERLDEIAATFDTRRQSADERVARRDLQWLNFYRAHVRASSPFYGSAK